MKVGQEVLLYAMVKHINSDDTVDVELSGGQIIFGINEGELATIEEDPYKEIK